MGRRKRVLDGGEEILEYCSLFPEAGLQSYAITTSPLSFSDLLLSG
jgi:hypothetical protein